MSKAILTVLLLVLTIHLARSRSLRDDSMVVLERMNQKNQSGILQLGHHRLGATNVTCEPTYGFLPCTTDVWGELFLIVVYEFLLSLSENYITSGSNLFFQMFGTGIFGASLFHMLGMFPQVIVILVSAVTATTDSVQTMAEMGMALLAGSVIMNLTLIWGLIIAFGSYNLSTNSSNSSSQENISSFSITGYGVETDKETKVTARIMLLSVIPFLLLQLATILSSSSAKRVVILTSLIIALIYLVTYCTYQVFQPWIQNRRFEYLMRKYVNDNLLQVLSIPGGKPNEAKIRELFRKIDQNNNSKISATELRAMVIGLQIEEVGLDEDDFVEKLMEEFDISDDFNINENEFFQGLSKWLSEGKIYSSNQRKKKKKSSNRKSVSQGTTEEKQSLVPTSTSTTGTTTATTTTKSSTNKPTWWNYTKAAFLILLGTAIAFVIATPLMTSIQDFATSVNVPSFLISYFVVPLALSFRMGYGAVKSVSKRTQETASLALSEIYGGVFMNNAMSLSIFLALVYIKNLTWDVSAEVLTVLIICSGMGLATSFSSKFPFWNCMVAFALYPISLAFIYVLTVLLGWG